MKSSAEEKYFWRSVEGFLVLSLDHTKSYNWFFMDMIDTNTAKQAITSYLKRGLHLIKIDPIIAKELEDEPEQIGTELSTVAH
jgi:hypothetical protein